MSAEAHNGVQEQAKLFLPVVGMTSLVWIGDTDYPLKHGNYCSVAGGPYLVNMWADNLQEWAARNPGSGPIEITVFEHGGRCIGMVTDNRLAEWCNSRPCITGHGWPSVAVMRLVCDRMGVPHSVTCGCEGEDGQPRISELWSGTTERPGRLVHICCWCRRQWMADKEADPW